MLLFVMMNAMILNKGAAAAKKMQPKAQDETPIKMLKPGNWTRRTIPSKQQPTISEQDNA